MRVFENLKALFYYSSKFVTIRLGHQKKLKALQENISKESIWQKLKDSEVLFLDLVDKKVAPNNLQGELELGPVLYWLNNDVIFMLKRLLQLFGMPKSNITKQQMAVIKADLELNKIINGYGMIISFGKYNLFDFGWLEIIKNYILVHIGLETLDEFKTSPSTQNFSNGHEITINLVGDFGTGVWQDGTQPKCPAQLIQDQMTLHKSDIHIHLGDIYYSGTTEECKNNFLATWCNGKLGSYNLNGNHDLYSGDQGYFDIVLKDQAFKIQNETSYFSFIIDEWLFLGLDTSYYSTSHFCTEGRLIDENQINFIRTQIENHKGRIAIITHHGPISSDGSEQLDLWNDIRSLMKSDPDVWYYGHIHHAIVFNTTAIGNVNTKFRCMGNGALPYGKGFELITLLGKNIAWLPDKPLTNPDANQMERLQNMFLNLVVKGNSIQETYYYQDGSIAFTASV